MFPLSNPHYAKLQHGKYTHSLQRNNALTMCPDLNSPPKAFFLDNVCMQNWSLWKFWQADFFRLSLMYENQKVNWQFKDVH